MSKDIILEAGKMYHVYNRGNNREDIFKEDKNYMYFMKLWDKYIEPIAETFVYCLLKNHFHFLIRIREEQDLQGFQNLKGLKKTNSSQAFSNLFNAYTKAFNKSYNRSGSLFQKNFRRTEVTEPIYYTRLVHYIHFNPQKHEMIQDYKLWPYSSYTAFIIDKTSKLQREKVVEWFGGKKEFIEFHNNNNFV